LYLPSKIKPKYIGYSFLFIFLLFLPFKNTIEEIFVFFSKKITTDIQFSQELKKIEEEKMSLVCEIKKLKYLKEENARLREALSFKKERQLSLCGVDIISFDPSSWRRIVIVNAGKDKGIKKGFFAIDEKGFLIGRIVEVKDSWSRLVLINDPDFNLPVLVGDSFWGLLKGGLEEVKILYIENDKKIKVKDKVWIKIANLNLPLYIGEIKDIRKDKNSLFWDLSVRLFSKNPLKHTIFIVKN
jgi:rod shape-determining protein MreC